MATRRRSSNRSFTGALSETQRRIRYLEGRPSYSKLANSVVQRANIEPRAISTDQIALAAVTDDQISADAITSDKIASDSVGFSELQSDSIGSAEIESNSVGTSELGLDAVINENVANDAIDIGNMGPNSVGSSEVVTDSVGSSEVGSDAATRENITGDAVGNSEISGSSVGSDEVFTDSVGYDELGVNAMNAENIQVDAVGNSELQTDSVDNSGFATDSVDNRSLAVDAVQGVNVSGGSVGTGALGDGAFGPEELASSGIGLIKFQRNFGRDMVSAGIETRNGIIRSPQATYYTLSAVFGTGSNTVARGNHTHNRSTIRIKEDIHSYRRDNPDILLDLQLKKFHYIDKYAGLQHGREWAYGYIAEELLENGNEEFVYYDKKGRAFAVNYALVGLFAVELVKQHDQRIQALKEEIKKLRDSNGN